jgi:hypothetical protein
MNLKRRTIGAGHRNIKVQEKNELLQLILVI